MNKLALLVSLLSVSPSVLSTELSIQLNPKYEDGNQTDYRAVKNKPAILGEQGNFGIRKSLEDKVKEYSLGYKERTQQILVHTRARDLFMIAETPDEAYNAYLLMTAAQKCLASKEGVGVSGASDILFKIAQYQIDTEVRRQAVIRSEYMLKRGDFPSLDMEMKNQEYCQFTNQPIIVNKELTEYLNETGS
ncbi:hypothetical protein NRC85_004013 [Vibrio parahaemolyticus]|nr:hypothetical protein [Vibrio parahaemolyticus]